MFKYDPITIEYVINNIEWAKKQGLLFEFLSAFLDDLPFDITDTHIRQAVQTANREWDL